MNILQCKRLSAVIIFLGIFVPSMLAGGMIDATKGGKLVSAGFRASINNSSVGINYDKIFHDVKNVDSEWKYGFDLGVVINLNLSRFLAIQPGFYFQNRGFDSSMSAGNSEGDISIIERHSRFYYFTLPVLASFRFQLGSGFELVTEAGPYFSWGLGGNTKCKDLTTKINENGAMIVSSDKYKYDFFGDGTLRDVQMQTFDWGLKFGAGFRFMRRYSIMIHYNAGCANIATKRDLYMHEPSAKNKSWGISLGYDF